MLDSRQAARLGTRPGGDDDPSPPAVRPDGSIKSMKKMLLVLECFSAAQRRLTPSEIARRAGLPRATAHRIIMTLRQIGFLEQDRERDEYRLGRKLFELGSQVARQADLHRMAAAPAAALARVTGEIVHLSVFDGLQAVIINRFRADPSAPDDALDDCGDLAPAHCTASGKAMLAFQPAAVVERVLQAARIRFTDATLADAAALQAELTAVRARGYAFDRGEWHLRLRCVAAPIRDGTGQAFAAIGLCGPAVRMPEQRLAELAVLVCENAAAIARHLGSEMD